MNGTAGGSFLSSFKKMSKKPVKYIQVDDLKGALYSADKQSLLVPVDFVKVLDTTFADLVGREGADILIYKIGEVIGTGYAQSLKAILEKSPVKLGLETEIKMCADAIFMEAGWGRIQIMEMNLDKCILKVQISYSPSREFLHKTQDKDKNRYSLEKGVLVGIFKEFSDKEVYCEYVDEDHESHSVDLCVVENIPDDFKEKEKIVLVTRKQLEEIIDEKTDEIRQMAEQEKELTKKMVEAQTRAEYADILEKKNDELEAAYDELKLTQEELLQSEKMATLGTIAGGVAHEINNPLGAILTNAQMLLMDTEDEDTRESLDLIEEATKRCQTIVSVLLNYTRKSAHTERKPVDITVPIEDALKIIGAEIVREHIEIIKKYSSDEIVISANSMEIAQVVTNMLVNAKNAIKKLSRDGRITISTYIEGEYAVIKVSDNGCGIPEDNRRRIFDPFFTTEDVGSGTGLGLSICLKIIEKHDGIINYESSMEKGTDFFVHLKKLKK